MSKTSVSPKNMTPYQVNVAGEAFAVVLFSQAGYDVAMQYGTTQPSWDMIATKGTRTLKLSVKGTQRGGWGLFQSHIENADYHKAIEDWKEEQPSDSIYLLIQFNGINLGSAPRCYLARPKEIAEHMHTTRAGRGYTSLREEYLYKKGVGKGYTDRIPNSWLVTLKRIDEI